MTEDMNVLKQRTARLSVLSNIVLVVLKLVVGYFTGAISIISEAAHSAVDLLAALIAYYSVHKAVVPPDGKHAYGHGKIETLSGAVEALLIIVAAVWIVWEAADKFKGHEAPEFLQYGILVMAVSIIVNHWVSGNLMKVAKATHSQALEADALHLKTDVWTSIGVVIGLIVIQLTGWLWVDPAIAVIVAAIVFRAGFKLTRKSIYELIDGSLPAAEEMTIIGVLGRHPEVLSFHQLRTRRSGGQRLIDMHVMLRPELPLADAHRITEEIEEELEERLGNCDVIIHLEPCGSHESCEGCKVIGGEGEGRCPEK